MESPSKEKNLAEGEVIEKIKENEDEERSPSKKKLSLSQNILVKHPSAIHLLNQAKEKEEFKEDYYLPDVDGTTLNLIPKGDQNLGSSYELTLSAVQHEIVDSNKNFYVKAENNESNKNSNDNNKENKNDKPNSNNFLSFTPSQVQFDHEITRHIQNGDDYGKIENKFNDFLRKAKK